MTFLLYGSVCFFPHLFYSKDKGEKKHPPCLINKQQSIISTKSLVLPVLCILLLGTNVCLCEFALTEYPLFCQQHFNTQQFGNSIMLLVAATVGMILVSGTLNTSDHYYIIFFILAAEVNDLLMGEYSI